MRVDGGMLDRMRGTARNRQTAIDAASCQAGIGKHRVLPRSCIRVRAERGGRRRLGGCRNKGVGGASGRLGQLMR